MPLNIERKYIQQRVDFLFQGFRFDFAQIPDKLQVFKAREIRIKVGLFRNVANQFLVTGEVIADSRAPVKHFSVRRLQQAREHFYGCAFARSVWPETAEHFPRLNAEADVRYGARRSVVLCQLPRLKHTNPAELEPKPAISFNENPRVTCSHSYRNATMGSTRIARMAGTKIAAMAINASNTATQTKLIGS